MEKLKTLKDFDISEKLKRHSYDAFCGTGLDYYDINSYEHVSKDNLKQEAIKLIKRLRYLIERPSYKISDEERIEFKQMVEKRVIDEDDDRYVIGEKALDYFLNITKEDLK